MITINDVEISFSNMGFFTTKDAWIHPKRIIDSFEIIYVIEGEFDMQEDGKIYHLKPKNLFILYPGLQHQGIKVTNFSIKFFWLHFRCKNYEKLGLNKLYSNAELEKNSYLFREIMSSQQRRNLTLCEIKLAELLVTLSNDYKSDYSKIVSEIIEFVRLNSNKNLTVNNISSQFGYSTDHCCRIIKQAIGISLHSLINQNRISYIKMCLLNTNLTVKEIANQCGFEDENMFVKFFKYHAKYSPSQYRNKHNGLKLNNH